MQVIPALAVPNQTLTVQLAGQPVRLNIYTGAVAADPFTAVYMDVLVNDAPVIEGVVCLDAVRIVRDAYLGFIGDFAWFDTQGSDNPVYTGLGARWVLIYLEVADLT